MVKIHGPENVLAHYQQQIDRRWKPFYKRHRKNRKKIMASLLFTLNYGLRPKLVRDTGAVKYFSYSEIREFKWLLGALEELLRRGWNQVDLRLSKDEMLHWARRLTKENSLVEIGITRSTFNTSKIAKTDMIEVIGRNASNIASDDLSEAYIEWLTKSDHDNDWVMYYESEKSDKIEERLRQDMKSKYGITQEILNNFSANVKHNIREHLRIINNLSNPLLTFDSKNLIDFMGPDLDPTNANNWLSELMYSPGRNFNLSPFLKLINEKQEECFIPIVAVFQPFGSFEPAWVYHSTKEVRESRASGTMGKDWGGVFEKYVRKCLRTLCPSLKVEQGNTEIEPVEYPDIQQCLDMIRKSSIEIDVIAYSTDRVYIISCKAPDMYIGPEMIRDLYFESLEDFIKRIEWDIDQAREILDYTKCVESSSLFLVKNGYESKEIIPIFITSDSAPLSFESVQRWAQRNYSVPEVTVIQANKLHELFGDEYT